MFSDILVELVHTKGVTMYELSQKTDIPQSLLSNYKNGKKKPALENIIKLADFFGVSTDYLLGRTDNPNTSGNSVIQSSNIVNGNNGDHSPLTVTETEQQDEMTKELVKAFQSMSFADKMEIMNAVLEKIKK